jgi:hypothetical protein
MHTSSALNHVNAGSFRRPQRAVAGSKSLASMLPTIITTGVITLVITGIMRLVWVGFSNDFFPAWMEAWFTTWPIAFPIAYLSKPIVKQLSNSLSQSVPAEHPALSLSQIRNASAEATKSNSLRVQRSRYIHKYY